MKAVASPYWITAAIVIGFLALQQVLVGPLLDPLWVAKPTAIAAVLGQWFWGGSVWLHLWTTLVEIALGFAIGIAVAVALAFGLSAKKAIADAVMPFIVGLYSLPKVALVPLFILLLGVGLQSKVAQVALNVVFIVFLNMYSGLTSINRRLIDSLATMGASPLEVWAKVKLPASFAWLLSGMRISSRYAISGAVVVELFTSNRGLGFLLASASARLDAPGVFAALALLAALGLLTTLVLAGLERRLMSWRL